MPRIRDLGIYDSALPPGPRNAISDVAGVTVGHFTPVSYTHLDVYKRQYQCYTGTG